MNLYTFSTAQLVAVNTIATAVQYVRQTDLSSTSDRRTAFSDFWFFQLSLPKWQ